MSKNIAHDKIKTRLSKKLDGLKIAEDATSHINPKIKKDSVEELRARSSKKLESTNQLKAKSQESGFVVSPVISKKSESLNQLRVRIVESKTPKSTSHSSMNSPPPDQKLVRPNTVKFNEKNMSPRDSIDHIIKISQVEETPKTETNHSYSERYIENKITELENVIKQCRNEINEMSSKEIAEVDSDTTIVGSNFEVPKIEEIDILPPRERDPDETLSQVRGMLKSIEDCTIDELTGMHDDLHTIEEEKTVSNIAENFKDVLSKSST